MSGFSDIKIWAVIVILAVGTYLLRWSFLGAIGNRPLPPFVMRLLRYTAVGVLPGLVAPLVLWPAVTGGLPDPARLLAAAATIGIGLITRNVLASIVAGGGVLFVMLYALG